MGGGSRERHHGAQQEVRNLIRSLRSGDQIALVVRSGFPGWINYVQRAEITMYYIQ